MGSDPGKDAASPTSAELVARACDMMPRIADRARQGERERKLPAATIAEMQEAGFFRVLQPKRWGGYELSPRTFFEIQMALAAADMSTAWVYGVVGLHPWLAAMLDDRVAHDVWGQDRSTLICSSLSPTGKVMPVEGGYRLSGRWKFSSGCEHCNWAILGGMTPGDDGRTPDWRLCFVPRADYEIIDTWDVSGLRATGSHDIAVADAFVPSYRTQTVTDNFHCRGAGQAVNDAPLYRIPFGQIFFRGISTPAIGALRGMLNAFVAYAGRRVGALGKSSDDPVAQLVCAETACALDEMTTILMRNFQSLEAHAEKGEIPPMHERLQYRFQSAAACERASLLAVRLFRLTGGAGLFAEQPFGRILADITASRQHVGNQYESVGRNWGAAMLGAETRRDLVL